MKNKWYRSGLVKGLLIMIMHVMAVLLVISMLWILACPSAAEGVLENEEVDYEESKALNDLICRDCWNIISGLQAKKELEPDGVFAEDKIVDIKTYAEEGVLEGEAGQGLSYTLGDLKTWQEGYTKNYTVQSSYESEPEDEIIVCRKPDQSYAYYYYSEFRQKIEEGELRFVMETEEITGREILQELKQGDWYEKDTYAYAVMDAEGNVKYTNCWNYDGFWIEEACKPVGAESVLEVANNDPEWNGKLEEAYRMIENVLDRMSHNFSAYDTLTDNYAEGNTNLTYLYADKITKSIDTNHSGHEEYDSLEKNIESLKKMGKYVIIMPKLADFESNINGINVTQWGHDLFDNSQEDSYVFAAALDTAYPIRDGYYEMKENYQYFSEKGLFMVQLCVFSGIILLAALIWLTAIAGRRPEDEEVHCNLFDRWKTEIAAALAAGVWVGGMIPITELFRMVNSSYYTGTDDFTGIYSIVEWSLDLAAVGAAAALVTCAVFLTGYLSLVRRLKAKTIWRDSFLRWLIIHFKKVVRHIPIISKALLVFGLFLFSQTVLLQSGDFLFVMIALGVDVLALYYTLRQAVGRKRLQEALARIADGEVGYQISLDGLKGDQLVIAEQINRIGEGLEAAVEANVKNERLKTDLITNVSHDIKTPLTSIINYVDLLKRENIQDPKVQDYLNILEAKAQRLKVLTEDVVEASKVSSGNIVLECMNLNLVEMVQQTSGEFAERFEQRGLKEILRLPDEPAVIWADGRRMWRILENIYGNAAKYAMEGSRIYADLILSGEEVVFSLKNISEQPLNISADELTERFIRGDVSRSTEGSGLGLSIAQNLASLMGGKFELYLDGDLFRVTITFPRIKK